MNFELARTQMLRQQVRVWEVLDGRVLDVLSDTPRELYVPTEYRELAFADTDIPLGHGQAMMAPKIEGRLLQALELDPIDQVLEIGTGSGFLTACLARLAGRVVSVEIYPEFHRTAAATLRQQGFDNIDLSVADGMDLRADAEFDAIAVTGSVPILSEHFIRMLRPNGRMFVVVGRPPVMDARVVTRHANGDWTEESLFETLLAPLVNAEQPEPFEL